jgi:hypothetical protein
MKWPRAGLVWRFAAIGTVATAAVACGGNARDNKPPLSTSQRTDCRSRGAETISKRARERSSTRADLDGDGRLDRVIAYSTGAPGGPHSGSLHLRAELASGIVIDRALDPVKDPWEWGSRIIGTTDVNDDRAPEVWLEVGGNTAHNVGLVGFADCELARARLKRGYELLYDSSGQSSAGQIVGVECTDINRDGAREIVETVQQRQIPEASPFAQEEAWSYVAFRLDGARLREVKDRRGKDLARRPVVLRWRRVSIAMA